MPMFLAPVKPFLPRNQTVRQTSCHGRGVSGALGAALLCVLCAACTSTDPNAGPLKGAASSVGWATSAPEPKAFVIARRGTGELNYVPIGRGGIERPIVQRNVAAVRDLETQLDQNRNQSESFARRQLPAGAYGQSFPSVAAPPRPAAQNAANERPTPGAPESYPVNPNRLRQIRENSRQVTD
jgi:hypothetical protein